MNSPVSGTLDVNPLSIDYVPLALRYLIVPDRSHRQFAFITALSFVAFITCFIIYATVEKYKMTGNFFYGRVDFSFIDRGYPESFGYFLEFICFVVFGFYAWAHKKKQWYAWSAIFLNVFLDDAFSAHEAIGDFFYAAMSIPPVVGGLIGFAIMGLLSAAIWFAGMVASPKQGLEFKTYILFSIYFALLVFFGVGVDAVHGLLHEKLNISETLATLFEDGGELFMTCIFCITALGMWYRDKDKLVFEQYAPVQK
jgi:hypothetical protein